MKTSIICKFDLNVVYMLSAITMAKWKLSFKRDNMKNKK